MATVPDGFRLTALSAAAGYTIYYGPEWYSEDNLTSIRTSWTTEAGYRVRVTVPGHDALHLSLEDAAALADGLTNVLTRMLSGGTV